MARPVLYVLAGVNGAGKSSIGGRLLTQAGLAWFNPDSFARALTEYGDGQTEANAAALKEGIRRLDVAIARGRSYAFETTLGGQTILHKLIQATRTHDIMVWFCGLRDAEQHLARVRLRVTQGGHDIPEEHIRQRCHTSLQNLIALMPHLAQLRVYDNSADVALGQAIPEPTLLLSLNAGRRTHPSTLAEARYTPDWAKPLVEAAFRHPA
jgi:predicted ABC-type ATPase